jgi:hypothetical protein
MHRVEVDQVRMGYCIACRVVDLHELELWPAPGCTQGETTDATKTVDTYFDAHAFALLGLMSVGNYDFAMSNWLM